MKQVLISKGEVFVEEVPPPIVTDDSILVKTIYSLISTGTELSGIRNSAGSIIQKAIKQPEKVKKIINRLKKEGTISTLNFVKEQLEITQGTGYSCSGTVIEVGKNLQDFKVGDRVACAGANHAEIVCMPKNLAAILPDNVNFDEAAFVAVGAIAMQGIRRAEVKFGENVAIIGLGLVGQITVQILKVAGCRVIGTDIDNERINLALKFGCDYGFHSDPEVVQRVVNQTNGVGVDTVIICAATSDNRPLAQAVSMTRKKGKVVVVGAVGLELNRQEFYEKELDLLISTSYGPGRYDVNYEQKGLDYPIGYVRWTEHRNMQEFLRMVGEKKLDLKMLISKVFPVEEAAKAYTFLQEPHHKPMALLLKYRDAASIKIKTRKIEINAKKIDKKKIGAAILGCGGFAKKYHLPNIAQIADYEIISVVAKSGSNLKPIAKRYNAQYATTDYHEVLKDKNVDMVVIATRHNLHAEMAIHSAKAGKAILLEKPMALNQKELDELVKVLHETEVPFMVGFNRRFSPFAIKIRDELKNRQNPLMINYRVNAGYFQPEHWMYSEEGGGRIVGECCHFLDLFNFFTESEPSEIVASFINPKTENFKKTDNFTASIKYIDGSIANLLYTSLGSNNFSKERIEIYAENRVFVIDDFKELTIAGNKEKYFKNKKIDKGQGAEMVEFAKALKNGNRYLIPLDQLIKVTEMTFFINKIARGILKESMRIS